MYVKNAHSSDGNTYSMPKVEFKNEKCCVKGCDNNGKDRAHVRKCDKDGQLLGRKVYIVPMCTEHNRSRTSEALEIKDSTILIEISESD